RLVFEQRVWSREDLDNFCAATDAIAAWGDTHGVCEAATHLRDFKELLLTRERNCLDNSHKEMTLDQNRAAGACDRLRRLAEAMPAVPSATKKKSMSVAEADQKGRQLAKELGKAFPLLSEREQARRIGCTWKTWS